MPPTPEYPSLITCLRGIYWSCYLQLVWLRNTRFTDQATEKCLQSNCFVKDSLYILLIELIIKVMFTSWTQCPCSLNFQFQNIVKVNSLLPLKVETCCQQEEGREESFMRILFTHDWSETGADIAGGDCCEDEIRIILQLWISQHSGAIICQHKQIFQHQNKSENN